MSASLPFMIRRNGNVPAHLLTTLHNEGLTLTESQVRWVIVSGKMSRPPLDGSLRFNFSPEHLDQLRRLFSDAERELECERRVGHDATKPGY